MNPYVAKKLIELQKTAKTISKSKEHKKVENQRAVNAINKSKVHKVQLDKKVTGKFSFKGLYGRFFKSNILKSFFVRFFFR